MSGIPVSAQRVCPLNPIQYPKRGKLVPAILLREVGSYKARARPETNYD